jgi:hypothetical protein
MNLHLKDVKPAAGSHGTLIQARSGGRPWLPVAPHGYYRIIGQTPIWRIASTC